MARLADYLMELAKLLGNQSQVHFKEIKRGSAVLVTEVEKVAAPKVRERLGRVEGAASKWQERDDTSEPFRKLNTMLAADNAIGKLQRGTAVVLRFPGRESAKVKIGPVTQATTIVGQLVRIGGRDKTSHAQVEDAEGRSWSIVMTREQARALAHHLYGNVMRFAGTGRWLRTESGYWEMDEMRLQAWEQVTNESLRESLSTLRGLEVIRPTIQGDPVAYLEQLRHGDDGTN
jgi:hypothetical protein